jgi:serine/threonine-protein kinase
VGTFSLASYTHREPLRVGALTQSFLASHPAHAERVVLKQLLPAFATNAETRERWLSLAAANLAPSAPSAFSVLESGECDGAAYLAVEHVQGVGLDMLLRRQRGTPVEVSIAVRIGTAILEQLVNAQQRGLSFAHLDVAPHSVIVRDDGSVVLTEHGLWNCLSSADAARLRFDKGRVPYLPPELAKSLAGDSRSDVFSTAAILFELLAGTRAFVGNTQLILALAIAEGKRKTLHELRPEVPEHVRHVVEAMLAHSPDERFQSARAALNALTSDYAVGANAREDVATWVARTRREEGHAPVTANGARMNAVLSHSGPSSVRSAGSPRTQMFGAVRPTSGSAAASSGPAQVYAPRSNHSHAKVQAPAGEQRATDVLDMANLLTTPRAPQQGPTSSALPAAQSYGANTPYPPMPESASSPPFSGAVDQAMPHPQYLAPPVFHNEAMDLAPPAFSPASLGVPSLGGPAAAFSPAGFVAPPPVSFSAGTSPPPMLNEPAAQHAAPAHASAGFPAPFDLGQPDPVPAAPSDIASRDGHTAFFKRGNAKHKQAIFVPTPLVMPPAPAASAAAPPYAAHVAMATPAVISAPSLVAPSRAPSWELAPVLGGVGGTPASTPNARPVFDVALAPMPRSDDMFRDPSGTLFQMKAYAKTRTAGEKRRMPLGIAVTLAAVFGFVAVTGGYLLFRLFS